MKQHRVLGLRRRAALLAGAAGAALGGPALAQDEIIVTGLKRDKAITETPLSVTAFTAETIEREGIDRPLDFIASTPNLTAVEANNAGDLRITIRGDAQPLNTDPPVALVIDGAVLTGATALNKDLLDVQQIEVYKGPLGYLYGRNAISGAIVLTTRQPTNEFEGRAALGYGNGDTAHASAAISGPIVEDKLLFSIAGAVRDSDGFYFNTTREENVDPYTEKSFRGRLDWFATEALKAQFSAFYSRINGGATNYFSQSEIIQTSPESAIVDVNFADYTYVFNVENFNLKEDQLYSLRLDWDLGVGTLTSITAYERQRNIFGSDGYPYTTGSGEGTQYNRRDNKSISQEIRFTSPDDRRFRYQLGGYFVDIDQTPYLLAAVGVDDAGFVRRADTPITSGLNQTTGFSADNVFATAWAVFASGEFDLTDRLELFAGFRYDSEEKEAVDIADGFSATAGAVRSNDYDQFQPAVGLNYQASDDLSVYARWGVGYKAGGFNAAQAFTITGGAAPNEYPKEKASNYEIGFKASAFDGGLTMNGAAFRTVKDNSQQFQFIPNGFLNAVTVIDEIRTWGFELEGAARAGEYFTLDYGVGYADAEVTELASNPDDEGNRAPYVPKWNASAGGTFVYPVNGAADFVANVNAQYWGQQFFDAANSLQADRDAFVLLNGRVALEMERWTLSLWAKNILDKRYNADAIVIFDEDAAAALMLSYTQAVHPGRPRTFGAEVSYSF